MNDKKAILCVDDEELLLHSLVQELRSGFGDRFYYETALNAQFAFTAIEELVQDGISIILIISDWLMPGLKGDEFIEQVAEKYPGIKAVMLTGQADQPAIDRVNRCSHVLGVLRKPWDQATLRSLINSCC